jgi:hypothetical protein
MWTVIIAFDLASIFALRRRAGTRSFVDRAIWATWSTFIGAVILVAVLNQMLGLKVGFLAPVVAVMMAMGFSTMGAVISRVWYLPAALFAAASVVMARAPERQFLILGLLWGASQFAAGLALERAKRRALAEEQPRLV